MLQKQTVTIPLGLGINTKTDDKLVEAGQFNLVCENVTFDKVGAVKKRGGYYPLPITYQNKASPAGTASGDYTALSNPPTCVAALGKSAFLRNIKGEYWYLHENSFIYNNSNPIPEVRINSVPLYSCPTTIDHTDTDYDSYENMLIAVGREGNRNGDVAGNISNGSTLILYDLDTESSVATTKISNVAFSPTFGFVRCGFTRVSGASYYYNVTVDSNSNLQVKIFNKYGQENATSFTIANIRTAGTVNIGGIAVCRSADDQSFYILANTTTNNLGKFIAISGTTKTFETTFATTAVFMQSMTAKVDSGLINLIYDNRKIVLTASGAVSVADAAVAGMSLSSVAFDQDSVNVVFGGGSGYSAWSSGVQTVENNNTTLMSDKVTISGIPVVVGKSDYDLGSSDEASYFLLGHANGSGRSGEKTYGRFATRLGLTAGTDRDRYYDNIPARFAKISSSKCAIALPQFTGKIGSSPSYQLQLFFFEVLQDYKSNSRAIVGKNLHFQGGFISEFDGSTLFENGFHTQPRAAQLNVTGGTSLTGTFSYILVAKYTDKNGQVTRSAPSSATSTGAITSKDVAITLTPNSFGIKVKKCSVEIYRTLSTGGLTYYYVDEVAVDYYSSSSISLYTDTKSDSAISSNAILYTAGNVLENNPAPSCKFVFQGGNRLFAVGLEDNDEIAYSKNKLFGESVNFSDALRIRFDTSQYNITGGCVAGGYMDGKVIIFKRNSIFYITGDGPNETGVGAFTEPELISADTGCTDPRSVVLTPFGLMFKGDKGIYVLSRGLETNFIGSAVEEFNSYQVTSAVHLDKKNQVAFSMISSDASQKVVLVFDYFTQQWSVTKGFRGIDSDVIDANHVLLDSTNSTPSVQDGTGTLDNTTPYSVKVKTPWIKLSGVQDFARIWTATLIGKYKSAHTLQVKVYYDYATDYVETFTIAPLLADSQYQYRIHLIKQKCESIQFEIQDLAQSGTGESMELTALTMEVGLKKGSMKLAASRKY